VINKAYCQPIVNFFLFYCQHYSLVDADEFVFSTQSRNHSSWADAEDWSCGDVGGGITNLAEVSYLWDFSSQPDSFTLATDNFTGISLGSSPLSFSDVIFGDDWGESLSATLESGTVSPVPEPGTILLLSSGLLGFAGFRKKFRKK
jgi:hypothetical protein